MKYLTHKFCWHDVQIKKNGNYIFAVSLIRMLCFLFLLKKKKKSRDFSGQELIASGFVLSWLFYTWGDNYQHRGRACWCKCHPVRRIIYSSDQKHKFFSSMLLYSEPFLFNTTQGSSLDLTPDPQKHVKKHDTYPQPDKKTHKQRKKGCKTTVYDDVVYTMVNIHFFSLLVLYCSLFSS